MLLVFKIIPSWKSVAVGLESSMPNLWKHVTFVNKWKPHGNIEQPQTQGCSVDAQDLSCQKSPSMFIEHFES